MADMIRKQFYIEPEQELLLKQRAKEMGVTEAGLVREALSLYTCRSTSPLRDANSWQRERAFIEELIKRGAVEKQTRWKREELYER